MGYWTKIETELIINLQGRDPAMAEVNTNWPKYASRLQSCEGFQETERFEPEGGPGLELSGSVSLAPYRYLYLRKSLSDASLEEFNSRKASLPKLKSIKTAFRLGTGERETVLQAGLADPYWLFICTDMTWWLNRLENNKWAVLLEKQDYAGSDDGGVEYMSTYAVPLRLLQIRRRRPQLSQQQKDQRLARLGLS